ncbi:MAG: hypothetical protein CMC48_03415 [Flavobacteriaceae bacterium]|nr:hypothetical protein [Flavobacteriaceae bacterium]
MKMKKILILAIFLFSFNSTAQFLQSRLLKVEQKNMEKFMSAVANKTKLYNSKEGQPRYITFQILTGPEAQNFVRMQYAPKVEDFDKIDKVGNAYWQKTTAALHQSVGNRIWYRNSDASYTPEEMSRVNHRRILYYKIKPGMGKDFWRYRTRLVKALKAAEWPQRVSTLNCASGCDGNWVQVRYHHKNFTGEASDNSNFSKVVEKYNEMYGEDSYEDDSQKLQMSVIENRTRHHQRLPELSSPWN